MRPDKLEGRVHNPRTNTAHPFSTGASESRTGFKTLLAAQNWLICALHPAGFSGHSCIQIRRSVRSPSGTSVAQRDNRWSGPSCEIRSICTDGDFVAITSRGAPIGLFCSNELPRGQPERRSTTGSMLDRARSRELRGVGSGERPVATFSWAGQTGRGSAPSGRSERWVLAQRVGPMPRSGGSFGPAGGWPGCASMVHRPRVERGRITKPRRGRRGAALVWEVAT